MVPGAAHHMLTSPLVKSFRSCLIRYCLQHSNHFTCPDFQKRASSAIVDWGVFSTGFEGEVHHHSSSSIQKKFRNSQTSSEFKVAERTGVVVFLDVEEKKLFYDGDWKR